jgi:hypothetical protein
MLHYRITAASLVTLLTMSCSAFAQDAESGDLRSYVNSQSAMMNPRIMSYMPSDLVSLVMQPHIVKELDVTQEQQKSIREIMVIRQQAQMKASMAMQELGKEMQKQFASGKQPDPEVIKKMQEVQKDFMASQQQVQSDADRAIFETLDRKQAQRLMQIQLQVTFKNSGLVSLAQEPLAEILDITAEQKRQLVEKQIEGQQELDEMVEVLRSEMQHQALTEILTKSQLDKLGTMKGDTLEAKRPDFYSQMLRRQVLKEEPTIGSRLLEGARKAVDGIKKELGDDEKKSDK